jgi:hypothetical protein
LGFACTAFLQTSRYRHRRVALQPTHRARRPDIAPDHRQTLYSSRDYRSGGAMIAGPRIEILSNP